ncbi:MAG: NAD(P)/FAD-dependent oxidoreductase [Candidatus Omnitrophota bacterium]
MDRFDVIVVGAGPAGMMAAIRAGERNRKVLLLEQKCSPGKKLLISGNGRCNLTNSCDVKDFLEKFSRSRYFLRNAFAKFFNTDLILFFENSGLKLKIEEGGRVLPKSDRAKDILYVLQEHLKNNHVRIIFGERVREITLNNKKIDGVVTYSNKYFLAARVVVATGGLSYPETGSTGDGYAIAEKLGHSIVPLSPALVPIFIKENFVKDWQGVALENAHVTLFAAGKKIDEKSGDLIYTHFGLSGPVVFDLSASVYDVLRCGNAVELAINFLPGLDFKQLDNALLDECRKYPGKSVKNMLKRFLIHRLIGRFLEHCGINENINVNQITSEERKKIIKSLSDFRLTVKGVMPINDAIVTRGGISTKEINPKTMESRLINGLFFAGEIIDVDAKTGGYNMQAAFSTGWVCGDSI